MSVILGASDLKRRITIRRATKTTIPPFNETVETWADLIIVWVKVNQVTDVEQYRAQEIGASVDTRFTIRYASEVAGVGPLDRVAFKGRDYNITGVREIDRNLWLEISAVARVEG
jgi:SPP1 family predicted phage head-tail adaptor